MRNRLLIDVLWIVVLFGAWTAVVYFVPKPALLLESLGVEAPPTPTGDPGVLNSDSTEPAEGVDYVDYYAQFEQQALLVLAIALLATLGWYVVGQWGPKPHSTRSSTWTLIWLLAIVFVVGGAMAVFFSEAQPTVNADYVAIIFAAIGVLAFYSATVLFSPVNVKYIVPGSKIFRRW